jgi:hypothetical protein
MPARGNALGADVRVTRLVLSRGERRLVLEQNQGRWEFSGQGECTPAPAKVARLLENLRLLDLAPGSEIEPAETPQPAVEVYESGELRLGFRVLRALPSGYAARAADGTPKELSHFNPALYSVDPDYWCSAAEGAGLHQLAGRVLNEHPELVAGSQALSWLPRLRASLRAPASRQACSFEPAKGPKSVAASADGKRIIAPVGDAEACLAENTEAQRVLAHCPAVASVPATLAGTGTDRVVELDPAAAAFLPDGKVLLRDVVLNVRGAQAGAQRSTVTAAGSCQSPALASVTVQPSDVAEPESLAALAPSATPVAGSFEFAFTLSPLAQHPCGTEPRVPYLGGRLLAWRFTAHSGKSPGWVSAARWKPPESCGVAARALSPSRPAGKVR